MPDNPVTNELAGGAKRFLGNKVGPLPLWAWFAVVIVTVYAVRKYQSRSVNVSSDETPPDPAESTAAGSGGPLYGYGVGGNAGSGGGDRPVPETNQTWKIRAINAVQGKYGALAASNAIGAWLAGQKLGPEQVPIIEEAVRLAGAPPEGAPIQPGGTIIRARSAPSTIRIVLTATPRKLGDAIAIEVQWLDQYNRGITGQLTLQTSPDGSHWVNAGNFPVQNGIGHRNSTISIKHGYWRATVPFTNTVYKTSTSNVVGWTVR